jgi:hypothetical protein
MATFRVTAPDGGTYEVNAPDGATEADAIKYLQGQMQQKVPSKSVAESFGRGALQGATFGTSDEIYAGVRGGLKWAGGGEFQPEYDTAIKEVRSANDKARQDNPIAYIGGEVAGGVALPMGVSGTGLRAAKTAHDLTLAGRMARAGMAGAASGGLYGFNTAEGGEGPALKQFSERAVSAIPSALAGGAVGVALPPLVDAGTAVVKGASNALRASMQPRSMAAQKVGEALARDRPDAAIDDALTYASGRLRRAQELKPGTVLADVGGQNTRDLLRTASNMPSPANDRMKRVLDARQGNQWTRIEQDLAENLSDGNKFGERLDKLTGIVKEVGSEEFKKAYSEPWNVRKSSELGRFLELPYVKRLREKAIENIEGMTGKQVADAPGAVAGAGEISPWEFLHRVKMQIDREITGLKTGQADSKANWDLRDLSALKRRMVDLMGTENGQFKSAMEKYGDAAGMKAALEDGLEDFAKLSAPELRQALASMTKPEQMMYRAGISRSIFNQLEKGNITRDRTESLFSSPEMQRKLEAVFPDRRRLRDFQRSLVLEAKMADTRKAVQGNSTTARQLAQAGESGQPVDAMGAAANLGAGRYGQVLNYLSRQVQRFHGMTPEVANETINMLMSKGALGTNQELQAAIERAAREPAFRDRLTRMVLQGVNAGVAASQPSGTPAR